MKPYLHDSWDQTDVRCDFIEDESGEWYKREDVHILLAAKDAEILRLKALLKRAWNLTGTAWSKKLVDDCEEVLRS